MKLAIGSDFVGYTLKEGLKSLLVQRGIEVVDYGTDSEEPCDFLREVWREVPFIWDDVRLVRRPPPRDHACWREASP